MRKLPVAEPISRECRRRGQTDNNNAGREFKEREEGRRQGMKDGHEGKGRREG